VVNGFPLLALLFSCERWIAWFEFIVWEWTRQRLRQPLQHFKARTARQFAIEQHQHG